MSGVTNTIPCLSTRFNRDFTLYGRNGSSYTGTQAGRWNNSLTNTKIYRERRVGATDIVTSRSFRLFNNTYHNMSKKEIFSYLVRNSNPTNR
jgi:hypothetical protein